MHIKTFGKTAKQSQQSQQPDGNPFDTEANTIETDLSGDDFLALCGNTAWRVLWFERRGVSGYRVKAERVTSEQPEAAAVRFPLADP